MPITKQPGQKGNLRIRYAPAGNWLNRMGACAVIAAAAAAASCMLAATTGAAATCLVQTRTEPAEASMRMRAAQLSLTKALLPPACLQLRGQDAGAAVGAAESDAALRPACLLMLHTPAPDQARPQPASARAVPVWQGVLAKPHHSAMPLTAPAGIKLANLQPTERRLGRGGLPATAGHPPRKPSVQQEGRSTLLPTDVAAAPFTTTYTLLVCLPAPHPTTLIHTRTLPFALARAPTFPWCLYCTNPLAGRPLN